MNGAFVYFEVESRVINKCTGDACNIPVHDQRPVIASTYYCITQVAPIQQERPFCMEDTKRCNKCKEYKDRGAFGKNASAKDKLQRQCKTCRAAYYAANRDKVLAKVSDYRATHRSEQAAYSAAYYAEHRSEIAAQVAVYRAEHREQQAAYSAAYRAAHREQMASYQAVYGATYRASRRDEIAARHAAYRAAHPDKVAACKSAWSKANPDKNRAYVNKRRALKAAVGGSHTADDVKRQGYSQNWQCWWRGPGCTVDCRDKYEVDHLVPLSRGGHNGPSNLVISCPHCNWSKNDKLPEEWAGRLL